MRDPSQPDPVPPRQRRPGPALLDVLGIVVRVCRLVLGLLAVLVLLGIVFTKAPTNPHNVLVRTSLRLARDAAGPFRDVFVSTSRQTALVENYALAAGVYLLLAVLVGKLATGRTRRS